MNTIIASLTVFLVAVLTESAAIQQCQSDKYGEFLGDAMYESSIIPAGRPGSYTVESPGGPLCNVRGSYVLVCQEGRSPLGVYLKSAREAIVMRGKSAEGNATVHFVSYCYGYYCAKRPGVIHATQHAAHDAATATAEDVTSEDR